MPREIGDPSKASETEGVQTLPAGYQHLGDGAERPETELHPDIASGKYRVTPPEDRPTVDVPMSSQDYVDAELEEMDVASIDEWLGGEGEVPTEYVPIPRLGKKIKIKALTELERRQIRESAPWTTQRGVGRRQQRVRDSEWIGREMLRRCILEPDFTRMDPKMAHKALERALSGEIFNLTTRINELSGFDMNDLFGNVGGGPE
jgi:hypothetical protein